ncbi:MAG: cytochrome P450, partial [Anaerolineae bacterium]|nr:cytochrome P450 [Anaerolineae bacterium]
MSLTYPPGPRPVFPILNLRRLQNERINFLVHNREQYGDVVYYRLGPSRVYQLNHPDYIQTVLVKQAEKFHKSPMLKKTTRQSIGTGLLTSDGDLHKRQRRLVQPAFHANRITAYADVMVDYTLRTMANWRSGAEFNMSHEMMELTMQIVAKTLFDADVTDSTNELGAAITVGIETAGRRITQIVQIPDWIPTPGNRERRESAALLESTIMGMINQRRSSGKDTGDLLSMLLMAVDEDDGSGMSNKQVRDEAMTLFIAGHETTANALTWTFYLLAQYPEVEARLVDELNQILDGRPPRVTDLPHLPYTE